MRASKFFFSTQKEAPADAELISHKLMMRAGLIRRLAGGIYTWMPLGLRVVRKIESIVREEMNRAGALEVSMPVVQPAELWQESGRYDQYGPELLRFDDRHKREFVLQPTSEEVVTDIARGEIRSYRQVPVHFYQIQTKFRDERRPRFGVMRGREFVMKDGYSFHANVADLEREYRNMYDTYTRIFSRIGLRFRAVAADTGSIGGSGSHEFHVLADSGEDAIAYCADSDFAANVELAEALAPARPRPAPAQAMARVPTPARTRCEDVAALLGIPLEATVKAVAVVHEEPPGAPAAAKLAPGERGRAEAAAGEGPDAKRFYLLLVRGDHAVNEIKVQKLPGLNPFRFATDREVLEAMRGPPGYIGPVGAPPAVTIIADRTVAAMSDFVCGANEEGYHLAGVNWGRDLAEPAVTADIRDVVAGDPSPDGKGTLSIQRGIEVGHIFQLRRKYSHAMKAAFLDASGKPAEFEMGCYGIGITRIAAAAIEQNHDERGIVWPDAIAPFRLAIAALGYRRSENVRSLADALYARLAGAGLEVLLDDRDERPGALLADLELIGIPHRVVIGDRGLAAGTIEYQARGDTAAVPVPAAQAEEFLKTKLAL